MKFFSMDEFRCRCCGRAEMDPAFLDRIDEARRIAGIPFTITSGYRCAKHNADVGSTSTNHTTGKAADIAVQDGPSRLKIVRGLIMAGFVRIGIAKTFIHADTTDSVNSIWLY